MESNKVKLGNQGLMVSRMGLGTMGMTAFYGDFDRNAQEEESLKTIKYALDNGVNFFDTAWIYQSFGQNGQNHINEELLGKAIKKWGRDKFIIATKFGIKPTQTGMVFCSKEETIRSQLSDSLNRLGVECIDLYYQHRMDTSTPIEETMRVLKQLVEEKKIKYIGLSECTGEELRRAHSVYPVSAIQMEYSLQTRDIENDIIPVARELGVAIVAYSPLGRGLLTGAITSIDQIDQGDWRRNTPRFNLDNFQSNIPQNFFQLAQSKSITPAQLALAWVMSKGDDIIPIPGTKSVERLKENIAALQLIPLSSQEIQSCENSIKEILGERYAGMVGTYNSRQKDY